MGNLKKVFLDSNIIFSASLEGESFQLLWKLEKKKLVSLYSSNYCLMEALDNLQHHFPDKVSCYYEKIKIIHIVKDCEASDFSKSLLPEKDAPILETALNAEMEYILTGDIKHFGELMLRDDLKIKIMKIRDFLLSGNQ